MANEGESCLDGVIDRLAQEVSRETSDRRLRWALDFLGCLPECDEGRRLLMLSYLPVYVCDCGSMHLDYWRCDACGQWPVPPVLDSLERSKLGGYVTRFWERVQDRRLFGVGMRIAGC